MRSVKELWSNEGRLSLQCLTNELKCGNGMCIDKANYCNGKDDCGDGSDEPDNCNRDCVVDLMALDPVSI